jgi:hypothetical protein
VPGYYRRFSADRFGIVFQCRPADRTQVEHVLYEAGAAEVLCDGLDAD